MQAKQNVPGLDLLLVGPRQGAIQQLVPWRLRQPQLLVPRQLPLREAGPTAAKVLAVVESRSAGRDETIAAWRL